VGHEQTLGSRLRALGMGALVPQPRDGPVTLLRFAMVIHFLLTDGPERKEIVALRLATRKSR
jgi:hypothetical protein